jgi:hypothetical protein
MARPAWVTLTLLSFGSLAPAARAADPATENVSALSALVKTCDTKLSGPYSYDDGDNKKAYICGDAKNAVYWTADMDIDCDGAGTATCNTGTDPWFQVGTAFGNNIDASKVPYFVIPSNFNLSSHGLGGGQIAAIIYNGKLTFAVLIDTGPANIIGEASYAAAKILGIDPDPETGGTDGPVTYIVFTGADARAGNPADHREALTKGAALAQKFITDNGGSVRIAAPPPSERAFRLAGRTFSVSAAGPYSVSLVDAEGREMFQGTGVGPERLDFSGIKPGLYWIRATVGASAFRMKAIFF